MGPAFPPFQTSHHLPPPLDQLPAPFLHISLFTLPQTLVLVHGPPSLYSLHPDIPTCIYTSLLHRFPRRALDNVCRANNAFYSSFDISSSFYTLLDTDSLYSTTRPAKFHGTPPRLSPDSLPRRFLLPPTFPAPSCTILAQPGSPDGLLVESSVFIPAAVVVVDRAWLCRRFPSGLPPRDIRTQVAEPLGQQPWHLNIRGGHAKSLAR